MQIAADDLPPEIVPALTTFAERLRQEFKRQNLTGTRKLSRASVRKYEQTIEDFIRSPVRHGITPVLGELTPDNVALWQRDQEGRGDSPYSIASRVYALQVFSNKFVLAAITSNCSRAARRSSAQPGGGRHARRVRRRVPPGAGRRAAPRRTSRPAERDRRRAGRLV